MLLIDAYNLLFANQRDRIDFRELEKEREHLIHLLLTYCKISGQRAILIFDHTKGAPVYGHPIRQAMGEIEIRFTHEKVTADEEIIATLESTKDSTAYTVISSDRAITDAAKKHGFKFYNSRTFVGEVAKVIRGTEERAPDRLLSNEEVDYWMNEFGVQE